MAAEIKTNKELPRKKQTLILRLKDSDRRRDMMAAGYEDKQGGPQKEIDTDMIAVGDSTETKNCTQTKAGCWQQDMKIRMINRHP